MTTSSHVDIRYGRALDPLALMTTSSHVDIRYGRALDPLSSSFSLHGATKSPITRPSLVLLNSGRVHFIPHVILHLMKYRLSILNKNGGRDGESEVHFSENEAVLFIAS